MKRKIMPLSCSSVLTVLITGLSVSVARGGEPVPTPQLPPPISFTKPISVYPIEADRKAILKSPVVRELFLRASMGLAEMDQPKRGLKGRSRSYRGQFNGELPSSLAASSRDAHSARYSPTFEVAESGAFWESPRIRHSKFLSDGMYYGATTFVMDADNGKPGTLISFRHGLIRGGLAWETDGADGRPAWKGATSAYSTKRESEFIPWELTYLGPSTTVPTLSHTPFGIGAPFSVPVWIETQVSALGANAIVTEKENDRLEFVLELNHGKTTQTLLVQYDEVDPRIVNLIDSQKDSRDGGWARHQLKVDLASSPSGIRYVQQIVEQRWVFSPKESSRPVLNYFAWKTFHDVTECDEFPAEFFQAEWAPDSATLQFPQREQWEEILAESVSP